MVIHFFRSKENKIITVQAKNQLSVPYIEKLTWLFDGAELLPDEQIKGHFVGPRAEMITPWSTNAVEITQNMGIEGILRIEEFWQTE